MMNITAITEALIIREGGEAEMEEQTLMCSVFVFKGVSERMRN